MRPYSKKLSGNGRHSFPQPDGRCRKRNQGSLLLDVLISLTLISLIGAMSVVIIRSTNEGEDFVHQQRQSLADLQRAVSFIERDLSQLAPRPIRDEFGDSKAALIIDETASFPLEFTRGGWPNPTQQQRSEQQRVAYVVEAGKLYRLYWPQLDRAQGAKPIAAMLLSGVNALSVVALPGTNNTTDTTLNSLNNDRQANAWPPTSVDGADNLSALPQAVEVTLEMETFGLLRRLIVVKP